MEGKDKISYYRSKLDKTLASPDLTNDENIHTLVKKQLSQSSHTQLEGYIENVVERRSKEVSNFLSMLRSSSENDLERSNLSDDPNRVWKVKQDTEEFRVMYREGPQGTPFHTLLVEGYVDGPLDVCLCISWESVLYQKWWPQTAVPTFKVLSSQCLKRVRTDEQISLIRMKVSWPLSSREALIHFFAFEYFQDDLMVVLLNSISDSEAIEPRTHGFTRDGIPDAKDVVRIDVVGGFALQKVTADRSFFRTIANMDIKLDFVPPTLINFISRQLVGSGFKLYKKEVAFSKGDAKFHKALKDPLYTRIHEALYSENIPMETSSDIESGEVLQDIASEVVDVLVRDRREPVNEIEEVEEKHRGFSGLSDDNNVKSFDYLNNEIKKKHQADKEEVVISTQPVRTITENIGYGIKDDKIVISSKVEQALGTMEKVISMFRDYASNPEIIQPNINNDNKENIRKDAVEEAMFSEADRMSEKNGNSAEPMNILDSHASRHKGSNSYTREMNQSKIVLDEDHSQKSSSMRITENSCNVNGSRVTEKNKKSRRLCCSYFISGY